MALTRPRIGQFNTNVAAFKDPIIVVNSGDSANNTDIGFVFKRVGTNNIALVWQEASKEIAVVYTNSSGDQNANVVVSGYANLQAEAITANVFYGDASQLTGITATDLDGQSGSYYLDWNNATNTPTTISGYGITDAYTKTEVDAELANVSVTASDVLTKIKTVDGAGSGLDADLLDGLQSTSANTASTIVARDSNGDFAANEITATATSAQYADLAENYHADYPYAPGTVLEFGGEYEVTKTTKANSRRIAGVVSTDPAHLMNNTLAATYTVPVALTGRVPCRVVGEINKGDLVVSSSIPGVAERWNDKYLDPRAGSVIGKALENKTDRREGTIEVVVGRL